MISFTELVTAVQNMRNLLAKGRGHKYIKRIPVGQTPSGGIKYRYIYNATSTVGGKNLLDEAHLKVGTKLMLHSEDGAEVHAHITEVKGDKVTFVYDDGDRKGETRTVTKQKLLGDFNQEHDVKGQLSAAKEKLLADIESAVAGGTISEKQLARLVERLKSLDPASTTSEMPYTAANLKNARMDSDDIAFMQDVNNLSKEGWNMREVVEDLRSYSNDEPSSTVDKWSITYELRDKTTITIEKDDDGKTVDSHRMRTVTVEKDGRKKEYVFEIADRYDNRDYAFHALFEFAEDKPNGAQISDTVYIPRGITEYMAARAHVEDKLNEGDADKPAQAVDAKDTIKQAGDAYVNAIRGAYDAYVSQDQNKWRTALRDIELNNNALKAEIVKDLEIEGKTPREQAETLRTLKPLVDQIINNPLSGVEGMNQQVLVFLSDVGRDLNTKLEKYERAAEEHQTALQEQDEDFKKIQAYDVDVNTVAPSALQDELQKVQDVRALIEDVTGKYPLALASNYRLESQSRGKLQRVEDSLKQRIKSNQGTLDAQQLAGLKRGDTLQYKGKSYKVRSKSRLKGINGFRISFDAEDGSDSMSLKVYPEGVSASDQGRPVIVDAK